MGKHLNFPCFVRRRSALGDSRDDPSTQVSDGRVWIAWPAKDAGLCSSAESVALRGTLWRRIGSCGQNVQVTKGARAAKRPPVLAIRRPIAQRHIAVLICAAALLLKLLVPTGHMIDSSHGRITITICSGTAPRAMTIEIPGMHGGMPDHGQSKDHGKAEMPCAFSGFSAAMLAAIDTIQLAALIAFVMAVGLVGVMLPAPSRPAYFRPPLRGPPATL